MMDSVSSLTEGILVMCGCAFRNCQHLNEPGWDPMFIDLIMAQM